MNNFLKIIFFIYAFLCAPIVFASGPNFNDTTNQPLTSGINPNFSVNVGIGSVNPVQKLDVNGTVRMAGFVLTTAPSSGYVLTSDASGNGTWAASSGGAPSQWITTTGVGIGTYSNVGIGTTTPQGAFTVTNGNVGIGTWVPGAALDTKGLIQTENYFQINSNTSTPIEIQGTPFISRPGGGSAVAFANANYWTTLEFFTGDGSTTNSEKMRITSTGNVGIGSISPVQALDVVGTVRMTGFNMSTSPSSGYILTSDGSGNGTWQANTGASGTNYWNYSSAGNIGISTTQAVGIGTTFIGGMGEAALAVMNGNVGIGTWAPAALFTVGNSALTATSSGVVTISGSLSLTGSTGTALVQSAGSEFSTADFGYWKFYTINTSDDLQVNVTGRGGSAFYIKGSNYNIGIGTNVPAGLLDVEGTGGVIFNGGNVGVGTTTPQGGFVVTNGNVGIGTWVPVAPLQINGNVGIGTNGLFMSSTPPTGGMIVQGNVGIGTWVANNSLIVRGSNDVAKFYNNTGSLLARISDFGSSNYGIESGEFFTSYSLQTGLVAGQLKYNYSSTGTGFSFSNSSGSGISPTSGSATSIHFNGAGNGGFDPTSGTAIYTDILLDTVINQTGGANGVSRGIFINPVLTSAADYRALEISIGNVGIGTISGNLGIGSTAPGQRLDVNGTVRMQGFNMSTSPSSGYILTSDGNGNGTWQANTGASGTNYWNYSSAGNIGVSTTQAVGIGTSFVGGTGEAALAVMNGNVGIGTWTPAQALSVNGIVEIPASNKGGAIRLDQPGYALGSGVYASITSSGIDFNASNNGSSSQTIGASASTSAINAGNLTVYAQSAGISGYNGGNLILNSGAGNGAGINGNLVFQIGGNEKARIDNNGNLGIGTTAPSGLLDLQGSGGHFYFTYTGNVGLGTVGPITPVELDSTDASSGTNLNLLTLHNLDGSTNASVSMVFENTTGEGVHAAIGAVRTNAVTSGDTDLFFKTTAVVQGGVSEKMRITSLGNVGIGTTTPQGAFVVTNGNVGIGTWIPAAPLEVKGNLQVDNNITFGSNNQSLTANGNLTLGAGNTATLILQTAANGSIVLKPNNVNSMFLVGSNVGIGSANPSQALDVTGTVRMTGFNMSTSPSSGYILTSDGNGNGTWQANTGASGTNYWNYSSAGNIGVSTTQAVGIGTSFVGGTGEAALAVMNGNVGIGTWVAAAQLDVTSGNTYIRLTSNGRIDFGVNAIEGISTHGTDELIFNNGSAWLYPRASNDVDLIVQGASSQTADLQEWQNHSGTVLSNVDSNGNFGIGTTTPQASLVVTNGNVGIGTWVPRQVMEISGAITSDNGGYGFNGLAGASEGMTSSGSTLVLQSSGANSLLKLQDSTGVVSLTANNGNIGIGTTTPQGSLVVTNGNVGIGTWAPNYPLVVNGAKNNPIISLQSQLTGGGDYMDLFFNSGTNNFTGQIRYYADTFQSGGRSILIMPNNKEVARFQSSGNVGIGSTVPGQALDVNGTVRATAFIGDGSLLTNTPGGSNYWANTAGVGIGTYNNVGIGTTTPQGGFVVTNGNVGIGTWAPAGALIVKGGNVGIGSLAPGQVLSVTGNTFVSGAQYFGTTDLNSGISANGTGMTFATTYDGGAATFNWVNAGFGSGITMVLTGAGKLGVNPNSSSPSNYLSVFGNGSIGSNYGTLSAPTNGLTVQGNVGIGTFNPFGGGLVVLPSNTGNVGIGSLVPGQALDVTGTVRMTGFNMSTSPSSGYILTSDGSGNGTWQANTGASGTNYWNYSSAGNIGVSTTQAVGIGTSFVGGTGEAALSVMNGNVGIGTWASTYPLQLIANGSNLDLKQAVIGGIFNGIDFTDYLNNSDASIKLNQNSGEMRYYAGASYFPTFYSNGSEYMRITSGGNVGIGTTVPGAGLNVSGTVAMQPSGTANITAGGGITVTKGIMRIQGSGGAVTVTANPQIAAGTTDGQIVIIEGMSSVNTVTIANGTGLKLAGGVSFTLGQGATITLMYDQVNGLWTEISRSAN